MVRGVMLHDTPATKGSSGRHGESPRLPERRSRRMFRFGDFELRTETGELTKHGIRIKVQAKPVQVLETLLTKPGELVTREELFQKLWPAGTFVDFENGLNTATNRLRVALSDSAEAPRYIETLPRLGYRFICPVIRVDANNAGESASDGEVQLERNRTESASAPESGPALVLPDTAGVNGVKSVAVGNYKLAKVLKLLGLAAAVLIFAAVVFAYVRSRAVANRNQPSFRQLTFHSGIVRSGRFARDARKIVYSAKWSGSDQQTYFADLDTSKSQSLKFAQGTLAAVSSKGDLAFISRDRLHLDSPVRLSRVSLSGGAAQTIGVGAKAADWAPNGRELAIVREAGPESVVEFPAGNRVYSSQGWVNCLRVSPKGDRIAFLEHPVRDDDAGHVRLVDAKGNSRVLTEEWNSIDGLAWTSSGKEIWFTASKKGSAHALYAVSQASRLRTISDTPSSLRLLDISSTGRVLITIDDVRMTMSGAPGLRAAESDMSNFDLSHADGISADGRFVLFTEGGVGGGQHYANYIHDQKCGQTFRVASGRGLAISSDGKRVLTVDPQDRSTLTIIALGSRGQTKVQGSGFQYQWAKFLEDGKKLLVGGAYPGEPLIICTQMLSGGSPVPITGTPYLDFVAVSPDGSRIAGVDGSGLCSMFAIFDQAARQISSGLDAFPIAWSSDNADLYALMSHESGYRILRINPRTGNLTVWKTIRIGDLPGALGLAAIAMAPATGAYAYSTAFDLSSLYLVDGWS